MKKPIYITITILLIILSVSFLAEIVLRLFWDGKPVIKNKSLENRFYPEPTPEISYTLKPNSCLRFKGYRIYTNEYGFRIPRNIKVSKEKGIFRVALLGDSIVFGYNTHEDFTISSILKEDLKKYKIPGINKVEILNFGIPGYNMTQYLAVLKKYGLKYKPDVIVVGISILNDFDGYFQSYLKRGLLNPVPVYDSKGYNYELSVPSKLLWNSYLFRMLYYKVTPSWEKRTLGPKNPPGEERHYRRRLAASCHDDDEIWDNVKRILDEFNVISKKNKIDIIFVLFPTSEQVYYHHTKTNIPHAPQKIISELLDSRGMTYIDLFDIFYSNYNSTKQMPFRDYDSHPDDHGYKLCAGLTADLIAEQGHFQLAESFNGTLNTNDPVSDTFLSYGWTGMRRALQNFRMVEGGEAEIVFDGFREQVDSIQLTLKSYEGCSSQKMAVRLNGQSLGNITIAAADEFSTYTVKLDKPVRLNDLNYLKLSFSCSAVPPDWEYVDYSRPKFYSAVVKSIKIE